MLQGTDWSSTLLNIGFNNGSVKIMEHNNNIISSMKFIKLYIEATWNILDAYINLT